jgi:DNA invertase Pin-like site-specific DNA recombinase
MASATRIVTYYTVPAAVRGASDRLAELSRATATFARARRLVVIEPFVEVRRGRARPELARALARCRDARAGLLVPSLAAVGSDLPFLEALLAARVPLYAADAGRARPATLRLLREVARHAQRTASDRSRHALRAARLRGVRLGSPRPEIGSRAGVAALRARADAHAADLAPTLRELLLSNPTASLRDLAALLEELGLPTPRRGRWGPSAVRNALRRAGLTGGRS